MSLITDDKFASECRIAMKWRIKEDYLKEALKNIDKDKIFSDVFNASNIPGLQYYLYLGKSSTDPTKITLYLHLKFGMTEKIIANCICSVKSASFKFDFKNQVYDRPRGWGKKLCTPDELFDSEKKFFVDGIMEIELDGTLKSQGLKRKAAEPLSLANVLWENENDKDITIVAEEQEIKIHKWVLSAHSPVFKTEMESGLKEAVEKKINIIDFSYDTVKIAVEYCYERDIEAQITDKNASELLHFSDKYNIEPLHNMIQALMIDRLSEANVCSYANMTVTSNALELKECCISFLMKFVAKSALIDGFAKLKKEITGEIGRRCIFSTSFSE